MVFEHGREKWLHITKFVLNTIYNSEHLSPLQDEAELHVYSEEYLRQHLEWL